MIPDGKEILRSVYGAWRLANLDASGMRWFELNLEGFMHSFFAGVLLAPFYGILVLMRQGEEDAGTLLLVEGLAYAVGWVAFPLIMIPLCRSLNLGRGYIPYIVAYNWSQVVIMGLWLPLTLITMGGLVGRDVATLMLLIGLAAVFYYVWFVTRTALQTTVLTAVGIVVVEYLTSLLVHGTFVRLL